MECEKIRIKMLETLKPDIPFLCKTGTIALIGKEYIAISNKYGAVSVICDNGERLGVKPGEFEFLEAPDWLLTIHKQLNTNVFEGLNVDQSLINCVNDILVELKGIKPTDIEILEAISIIPDNILLLGREWGYHDTEFGDKVYEWLENNIL